MNIKTFVTMIAFAASCTGVFAQDSKPEVSKAAKVSSTNAIIMLTRGRQIEGDIASMKTISAKTNFGDATFPLEKIEGIKLHADENDSCIFAFKNGDLVTGQLAFDKVQVTTDWGEAGINIASIEVIKLNPKGEFFQDSTGGKARWRYGETREVRQQRQAPVQPTNNTIQQPNTTFRNNR